MAHNRTWRRLDNAGLIFPASRRKGWYNKYRISADLKDPIDPEILQSAFNATAPRFPLMVASLKRGFFWYYLEQVKKVPQVMQDGAYPLIYHPFDDVSRCTIRVLYYRKRIAVEFFHAATDGGGAIFFVKSLVAEYIEQRYGIKIPFENGVLDRREEPKESELEDSFSRYRGQVAFDRHEGKAYRINPEKEPDGFLHLTCGTMSAAQVLSKAREYHTSVTVYVSAILTEAILEYQKRHVPKGKKKLPVRIQIPVNLRKLFPSETHRNFVMTFNIGVDPMMGEYTFDEIVFILSHQLALYNTPKNMQAVFTTNVNSSRVPFLKIVPRFIKTIVMRKVFDSIGENQATICLSNLGPIKIPEEMQPYVDHFDFIIGPQAQSPYNCSLCSYGDIMRFNFIRGAIDPELERLIFTSFVKKGIHVTVSSNRR